MINIDVPNFYADCSELAAMIKLPKSYKGIYGIPKNGMILAFILSKQLGIEAFTEPFEGCLIVDDIVDSGKTIKPYLDKNKYDVAVLYNKSDLPVTYCVRNIPKNEWIKFWFEKENDIEDNVTRIIEFIGEDSTREGLLKTPERVVKSWHKLYGGYKENPAQILQAQFTNEKHNQIILLKNIEMYSTCEHHMLPFFGRCHIGYIPETKIVGISKLARLMECFSRRLQIQERMTDQIADAIDEILNPKGVMVVIEAQHFCMTSRGVEKQNSIMVTSAIRGVFEKTEVREEFLNLIGR